MRKSRLLLIVLFSFLALFFLFLSGKIVGTFSLNGHRVNGLPKTWFIEGLLLGEEGKNILVINKGKIKREILSLPYVSSLSVSLKNQELIVEGESAEWGMIVTDNKDYYFVSSLGVGELDRKDVSILNDYYLTLTLSSSVLETIIKQEGGQFVEVIKIISQSNSSSSLITSAEYDNNKMSIFSGSLLLNLDQVQSTLTVSDLREIGKLGECLDIIEQEYYSSKDRLTNEKKEYILEDSMLVVKKR